MNGSLAIQRYTLVFRSMELRFFDNELHLRGTASQSGSLCIRSGRRQLRLNQLFTDTSLIEWLVESRVGEAQAKRVQAILLTLYLAEQAPEELNDQLCDLLFPATVELLNLGAGHLLVSIDDVTTPEHAVLQAQSTFD